MNNPAVKSGTAWVFVIAYIIAGGLFVWYYLDLIFVRNSIFYAGISQAITEHGLFEAREYAVNKPLGFSILAWPLTSMLGVNVGLKLSSFIWTSVWVYATLLLLRRLTVNLHESESQFKLALVIALFNPLIFYQFVSAYPDTLFASLFVFAVLFLDRAFSKDGRLWDSVIFAVLLLASVWVKHHGFVLLPIAIAIGLLHRHDIVWQWKHRRNCIRVAMISIGLALVVLGMAQAGMLSLYNLGHNIDNFTQSDEYLEILEENIGDMSVWLLLSFGFLLPFLLSWRGYLKQHYLLLIILIFIIPILFYAGASYNIRYFIAVTPLFAWVIARELGTLAPRVRTLWMTLFILGNSFTILYYNNVAFNQAVHSAIALPKLDNLRLVDEQKRVQNDLDMIKLYADEYDNTLVFVSRYYSSGTFGIWEKAGVFPEGMKIHYIKRWKTSTFDSLGLDKAIVYEYLMDGVRRTTRYLDRSSSKLDAVRLSKYLYLVEKPSLLRAKTQ